MLGTLNPQAKAAINVRTKQSPQQPDFANSNNIDSLPDDF